MIAKSGQTFGQLVRERRLSLDLTQEELAQLAGCATISARRIEAGTLRPSTQLAEQLAAVLAIPAKEHDDFIKLARSVTNGKSAPQENSNPLPEPGMDGRMWRHTEYLLPLLPLIFLGLMLIINPSYVSALTAVEPPFLIVNLAALRLAGVYTGDCSDGGLKICAAKRPSRTRQATSLLPHRAERVCLAVHDLPSSAAAFIGSCTLPTTPQRRPASVIDASISQLLNCLPINALL